MPTSVTKMTRPFWGIWLPLVSLISCNPPDKIPIENCGQWLETEKSKMKKDNIAYIQCTITVFSSQLQIYSGIKEEER